MALSTPDVPVCAYCEATAEEVVAKYAASRLTPPSDAERKDLEREALVYVLVGQNRVLLCPDDRQYPHGHPLEGQMRAPLTEEEQWELLMAPIDLPPGVTVLQHCCPMLSYDGYTDEEATFKVELELEGDYMVGKCVECGMQVRSPVLRSRAAGERTTEGG